MVPLLISLTTIILTGVVLYYLPRRGWKIPPGPPRRFIIGNIHQLKPHWTESFSEWSRIYGPIISVWLGSQLVVIVSSSDLAKQVLKDKDHQLSNRHRFTKMTKNGNDLIWSDYSPHYVKLRKLSTLEIFSLKSIESFKLMREIEAKSLIRSIFEKSNGSSGEESKKLVVREYLGLAVLNTVSRLVIGKKFESEEGNEFRSISESEDRMATKATLTDFIWWLRWISSWFVSDKELDELMDRRRKWFRRAVFDDHGEESFLQRLLVLQERKELREETVVGLLWNMFTAGADTTVITIEWTIAEMIRYPALQEKLQQELDSVLGTDRLMTESDIPKLKYLQCVAKEALRLHPPTPLMLPHKASETVQIGGYEIPKGTTVYVNVQAIGRDPVNWRNPDEFKPERFLLEDTDVKGQDFRILPFGSGRRVCPAAQLSINMMTLMLGNLLHCFSWRSCTPEEHIDMAESPGLVCYMKTPLKALVSCRLPQELYTLSLAEIDR